MRKERVRRRSKLTSDELNDELLSSDDQRAEEETEQDLDGGKASTDQRKFRS
jgi:hypothetical protein